MSFIRSLLARFFPSAADSSDSVKDAGSADPINTAEPASESARKAGAFVNRLAALAGRLAGRNMVINKLECYWGSFGSWRLEVQEGTAADQYGNTLLKAKNKFEVIEPEVVRFAWDGRETTLTVDVAPPRKFTHPPEWKKDVERKFAGHEPAIEFLEDFLRKRW